MTKKFVDSAASIPEDVQDVMYYTLSVGHHTGVIDCFESALEVPLANYERIVALVDDETARYKLSGIMRFGEIEIDKTHVPALLPALREVMAHLDSFDGFGRTSISLSRQEVEWLGSMIELLLRVKQETNVYLMVRRVDS